MMPTLELEKNNISLPFTDKAFQQESSTLLPYYEHIMWKERQTDRENM